MKNQRLNMRLLTQAKVSIRSTFQGTNSKYNKTIGKETWMSSKKFLRSNRKMGDRIGSVQEDYTQLIKEQIVTSFQCSQGNTNKAIIDQLTKSFNLCEKINSNFYSYLEVEGKLKELQEIIKGLNSITLQYKTYALAGFFFYEFGSYSLSLFNLDRALKKLYEKNFKYAADRFAETLIYKYIVKVFLEKGNFKDAKSFCYILLRKTWFTSNVDEQINAFDLLGAIEMESGNIQLGKYFHWRMCLGIKENKTIKNMSNKQLEKQEVYQQNFSCSQNLLSFVEKHEKFHEILDRYYHSESNGDQLEHLKRHKGKNVFLYTHRSRNRNLKKYHLLERKLIDSKSSQEIHFVKPREIKKMRKLISEFNSMIFHIRRTFELHKSLSGEETLEQYL